MLEAKVIGSGIVGPMAAIQLHFDGYNVDVYEARPESDLHSDGILGITEHNWLNMHDSGVYPDRYELPNTYTNGNTGETAQSDYHYITWTDLHKALTARAIQLGIIFHYGEKIEKASEFADADVIVWTTGIASAKHVTTGTYTGYVVIRGLAYQFSGSPWTTLYGESDSGEWLFNVGDTRDGASIEMFVKRESVQMRTTYSPTAPVEAADLPVRWRRLLESVSLFQMAPLSDWAVPQSMAYNGPDGQRVIRMGDANGQMRPQTSMGANLGLSEAWNITGLVISNESLESALLSDRQEQFKRGVAIGIQRGKFSK